MPFFGGVPDMIMNPFSHPSPPLFRHMPSLPLSQATSLWRQTNYAETLAASRGRTLVRLNLDETAVCLFPGRGKGAVFLTRADVSQCGGQKVPRWKRRCYMTHVGVLADDAEVQRAMPQVIVANERTLQARALSALRLAAPPNVLLLRQKSAWSSALLTARIVRLIAAAVERLHERLPRVQILLYLDAAKIHLTPVVLRACRDARVWLIIIPARTTFCLQPLDVHVFALYKACLIGAYQAARARSGSGDGDLEMSEFLPCVYQAIREVLEGRSWAHAFAQNGLGSQQRDLSGSLKRRLQLAQTPAVSDTCPSDGELRLCFPRRSAVPLAQLRSLYEERVARPALLPARAVPIVRGRAAVAAAVGAMPGPRTRGDHRRAAAAAAAAGPGPAAGEPSRGAAPDAGPLGDGRSAPEIRRAKAARL